MYAHALVLVHKDQPIQFFAHPNPDSQPIVVPFAAWQQAANS